MATRYSGAYLWRHSTCNPLTGEPLPPSTHSAGMLTTTPRRSPSVPPTPGARDAASIQRYREQLPFFVSPTAGQKAYQPPDTLTTRRTAASSSSSSSSFFPHSVGGVSVSDVGVGVGVGVGVETSYDDYGHPHSGVGRRMFARKPHPANAPITNAYGAEPDKPTTKTELLRARKAQWLEEAEASRQRVTLHARPPFATYASVRSASLPPRPRADDPLQLNLTDGRQVIHLYSPPPFATSDYVISARGMGPRAQAFPTQHQLYTPAQLLNINQQPTADMKTRTMMRTQTQTQSGHHTDVQQQQQQQHSDTNSGMSHSSHTQSTPLLQLALPTDPMKLQQTLPQLSHELQELQHELALNQTPQTHTPPHTHSHTHHSHHHSHSHSSHSTPSLVSMTGSSTSRLTPTFEVQHAKLLSARQPVFDPVSFIGDGLDEGDLPAAGVKTHTLSEEPDAHLRKQCELTSHFTIEQTTQQQLTPEADNVGISQFKAKAHQRKLSRSLAGTYSTTPNTGSRSGSGQVTGHNSPRLTPTIQLIANVNGQTQPPGQMEWGMLPPSQTHTHTHMHASCSHSGSQSHSRSHSRSHSLSRPATATATATHTHTHHNSQTNTPWKTSYQVQTERSHDHSHSTHSSHSSHSQSARRRLDLSSVECDLPVNSDVAVGGDVDDGAVAAAAAAAAALSLEERTLQREIAAQKAQLDALQKKQQELLALQRQRLAAKKAASATHAQTAQKGSTRTHTDSYTAEKKTSHHRPTVSTTTATASGGHDADELVSSSSFSFASPSISSQQGDNHNETTTTITHSDDAQEVSRALFSPSFSQRSSAKTSDTSSHPIPTHRRTLTIRTEEDAIDNGNTRSGDGDGDGGDASSSSSISQQTGIVSVSDVDASASSSAFSSTPSLSSPRYRHRPQDTLGSLFPKDGPYSPRATAAAAAAAAAKTGTQSKSYLSSTASSRTRARSASPAPSSFYRSNPHGDSHSNVSRVPAGMPSSAVKREAQRFHEDVAHVRKIADQRQAARQNAAMDTNGSKVAGITSTSVRREAQRYHDSQLINSRRATSQSRERAASSSHSHSHSHSGSGQPAIGSDFFFGNVSHYIPSTDSTDHGSVSERGAAGMRSSHFRRVDQRFHDDKSAAVLSIASTTTSSSTSSSPPSHTSSVASSSPTPSVSSTHSLIRPQTVQSTDANNIRHTQMQSLQKQLYSLAIKLDHVKPSDSPDAHKAPLSHSLRDLQSTVTTATSTPTPQTQTTGSSGTATPVKEKLNPAAMTHVAGVTSNRVVSSTHENPAISSSLHFTSAGLAPIPVDGSESTACDVTYLQKKQKVPIQVFLHPEDEQLLRNAAELSGSKYNPLYVTDERGQVLYNNVSASSVLPLGDQTAPFDAGKDESSPFYIDNESEKKHRSKRGGGDGKMNFKTMMKSSDALWGRKEEERTNNVKQRKTLTPQKKQWKI